MTEIWKDIEEYKGIYQVSNMGRIKSLERLTNGKLGSVKIHLEKILTPLNLTKGYQGVRLYKDYIGKTLKIHRIVAKTFICNPNNLPQVNHINGNKKDNKVSNLEWCDNRYNMDHALDSLLIKRGFDKHFSNFNSILFSTIQPLLDCGLTCKQLSLIYNVDRHTISTILSGKSYKHLNTDFKVINRFNKSWLTSPIPFNIYEILNKNLEDNTVLNSLIAEGKLMVESQCNA